MSTPDAFRRDLVERLAATDLAHAAAQKADAGAFAVELGVQPDVLDAAVRLARAGFVSSPGGAVGKKLDLFVPTPVFKPLAALASRMNMHVGQLIASTLHVAMQTQREPCARARRVWGPLPGCEAARARLTQLSTRAYPVEQRDVHLTTTLSVGLHGALTRRALAYGVGRHRYMTLWVADLVDGRLGDLPVAYVDRGQMFDDERAYVLPVLAEAPKSQ